MHQYRKYWIYTLAPVVLVLSIAYWSFAFIEQTIRNHPELNLMILGVIALSVFLVFSRQYGIWKEARIFETYRLIYENNSDHEKADDYLKGRRARVIGLLRMVGKLDGKIERTIDQHALTAEMDALKEHFLATLSLPNFMSGFMVALGLFGTFVGLLETLKSSGELLAGFSQGGSGDIEAAVTGMLVGMKGPLSGMATAFSASLFGLLGSLLTGIMINTCQSMSRRVEHEIRLFIGHVVKMSDTRSMAVTGGNEHPASNAFLRDMMARVMEQQSMAVNIFEQSRQADIETKSLFVAVVRQLAERADFVERSLSVQENMRQISLSQAQQTQQMLEQMARHEALLESFHKRMINAERAGDALERIATQIRESFQATGALVRALSHAQMQSDERQEKLFASGVETLNSYHQTTVESQQRLLDGLKDLGSHLGAEVARFDHRQVNQVTKFIELQTKTSDLLQHFSATKNVGQAPATQIVEVARDIRKSRELLQADMNAEFREIKRMVNFIIKRVGA